jgi:hypothetical protein
MIARISLSMMVWKCTYGGQTLDTLFIGSTPLVASSPHAGFVTLRQTFVRRCHDDNWFARGQG